MSVRPHAYRVDPRTHRERAPSKPNRQTRESRGGFSLGKRKRQQARAQQHEAGCGQCEESVGDQIVIAHDTPATSDALPSSLKLSEQASWEEVMRLSALGLEATYGSSPFQVSSPVAIAFECMGQKDRCAHQAHNCRNRPNHHKLPVRPCARRERLQACTVKKIHLSELKIGAD